MPLPLPLSYDEHTDRFPPVPIMLKGRSDAQHECVFFTADAE
jgi:hypothetical protein